MSDNAPKNLVYVGMSDAFSLCFRLTCSFLGGLDLSVTEGDLYTAFIPFGEIVATYLPRNQSSKSGIFCFLVFDFGSGKASRLRLRRV